MSHEDDFGIIGATLANAFHVERVVAHGGFAIVYRGIHGGFRAPIALKCLRIPDGMTDDQKSNFLERFREEGELFRLSAAIPEIVRPLHIDAVYLPTGALMPFLALEWLDGQGFDQVLIRNRLERKTGIDLASLVTMLRPVAQALARAHNFPAERGTVCVVHRDLKPENLFLCQVAGMPSIKILDYGIAEVCSVAQRMSGVRAWRGMNPFTPGYGAPEQWAPDRFGPCGPFTDVWGLALTMVEALTNKIPIEGDNDSMRRTALDPRRRPTPRSLGAIVSNDLEATFQRALALDPRSRTQDILTFWTEVETAAGLVPSLSQSGAVPAARPSRRGSQELELSDSPLGGAIDLDLAVEPESLRGPRLAVSGTMPAVLAPEPESRRGSRPSTSGTMPAILAPEEASEADLPTYDEPPLSSQRVPLSQRPPSSGPRSVRPSGPPSSRPSYAPDSPPASARVPAARPSGSVRPPADSLAPREPEPAARPALASEPDTPLGQVAAVIKGRLRVPAILLAIAIGLPLIDLVVVRVWGQPMSVGPIRSYWVAGPLALIGGTLLIWKLVVEEGD